MKKKLDYIILGFENPFSIISVTSLLPLFFGSVAYFAEPSIPVFLYYFFLFFSVITLALPLIGLTCLVFGMPYLKLTQDELVFVSAVRFIRWPWRDIGVFYASYEKLPIPKAENKKMHWVIAYTDETHDLLAVYDEGAFPTVGDCDIKIPVGAFGGKDPESGARTLAAELNSWRDSYGAPEIEPPSVGAERRFNRMAAKLKKRRARYEWLWAASFTTMAVAIVVFKWALRS